MKHFGFKLVTAVTAVTAITAGQTSTRRWNMDIRIKRKHAGRGIPLTKAASPLMRWVCPKNIWMTDQLMPKDLEPTIVRMCLTIPINLHREKKILSI